MIIELSVPLAGHTARTSLGHSRDLGAGPQDPFIKAKGERVDGDAKLCTNHKSA
jgi:hypothetical protein